jgi:hypothetical protein
VNIADDVMAEVEAALAERASTKATKGKSNSAVSREDAVSDERAVDAESIGENERAVQPESTVLRERAVSHESTEKVEQAERTKSTADAERAMKDDSAERYERATERESTGPVERAAAQESTDRSERTAAVVESTEDLERAPWPLLPESTTVHPSVDLGADDPAYQQGFRGFNGDERRCVAQRRDGHRCNGRPPRDSLACPFHDGRSDPVLAGRNSQKSRNAAKERAEQVLALQKLGVRATVAHVLSEKASEIRSAVALLADSAAGGDLKSAQALLPWIDQALGRPTERHEVTTPTSLEDLESMDTGALERLVAEGRARRLRAVGEAEPGSA